MPTYHLANLWEQISDLKPGDTALIHGDLRRSWQDFDQRSARLAAALKALGLGVGDIVAIAMYNCPEWLETFYAALKIRAVPANVNYRYKQEEMRYLLRDCSAAAVVYHASLAPEIEPLRTQLKSVRQWIRVDDAANQPHGPAGTCQFAQLIDHHSPAARIPRPESEPYISYTGGTTGLPKGVLYRLGLTTFLAPRFVNQIFGEAYPVDVDKLDMARQLHEKGMRITAVVAPPLMHSTGLALTSIPTLAAGGCVVTMTSRSFDPHHTLSEVERTGANRLTIVGDAFARPLLAALKEGRREGGCYQCSSLRVIVTSGAALSASTAEELFQHLPHIAIMESCGATEGASLGVKVTRCGEAIETGRFQPSPGLLLLDEELEPLPDQVGQRALLAAPAVTSGYLNDPEKTAERYKLINDVLYAVPGDYGRLDPDGTLLFLGRGSSVINTGGEKVHPEEVEDSLKRLEQVFDCLVIGMPDELLGQSVTAVVQCREGDTIDAEAVVAYVKQHLAGYKAPRAVIFVAKIPRGPNGKADYAEVRELAERALQLDFGKPDDT